MIDLTYYETVAEGDKAFIRQMVLTFLEDVPLMLESAHRKLSENDLDGVAKSVHKLKPAWTMSGLDANLIFAVEKEVKGNGNVDNLENSLIELDKIAKLAIVEMEAILSSINKELGL